MRHLRLATSVATILPQCFLVCGNKVSVPQGEMTDKVNRWSLAVVHSNMIIITMNSTGDAGSSRFLA
jgi:hypothetical protein